MDLKNFLVENQMVLYVLIIVLTIILIILLLTKNKKNNKQDKKLSDELIDMVIGDSDAASEDKKEDLTNLLEQMQRDVEKKANSIDTFEHEQEENAIISYKELVEANRKLKEELEKRKVVKIDNDIKPQEETEEVVEPIVSNEQSIIEDKKENKKFQTTDFISPIYGKQTANLEYPTVPKIERDNDYVKLEPTTDNEKDILDVIKDEEETEEFLETLKEFRKNLN